MANYKRVISYMYAYRNQLKGSNVGFARIETRGNECKITLHVRTVNMKDQEVGAYIYCWYGQELHAVYLGDIHISNGVGEIVIKTDVDNIMKTKYRFSDMGGILLYISDAQYIATEWDGKAIVFNSLKIDTVKPDTFGSATPREKEPSMLHAAAKENSVMPEKKPVIPVPSVVEKESVAKVESAVAVVIPEEKKQPVVQAIEAEQTLDDMIEQEAAKEEQQEEKEQQKEEQQKEERQEEREQQEEEEEQQRQEQQKEQEPPAPLLRRNPFVVAMEETSVEQEKKSESKTKIKTKIKTETEIETETKVEEKVDIKEDITVEKKKECKDEVEAKQTEAQQTESVAEQDMTVDVTEAPEQEPLSKAFPLSQEKMERLDQQAQELFGTMLLNTLFPPEKKEAEKTVEASKKEESVQEASTEQRKRSQDEESEETTQTLSINPRNAIECFTAFRSCESAEEYDEIQEEISTMKAQVAHLKHISEEWKIKEARLKEIEREREEAKRGVQAEEEKHKIEKQIRSEFNIGGIEGQLAAAEVKRVMNERVFMKYPKIMPFEQGEAEDCVRIAPQDLGIFPMENWILANNSFLLHGYYMYRHLVFLMENDGGVYHYLLGVPGVNHSREQFMANMFGFTRFKKLSQAADESGEFGYWCQEIIL